MLVTWPGHCPLIGWLWPDHPHCARHCWLPTDQPPAFLWSLGEKNFWCGKKSGLTNNLTPFKCAGVNMEPARNSFVVSEINHKPKGFTILVDFIHIETSSVELAVVWCFCMVHYCKQSNTAASLCHFLAAATNTCSKYCRYRERRPNMTWQVKIQN